MKKWISVLLVMVMLFAALPMDAFHLHAHAASISDLTYSVADGNVTITDCQATASGVLTIPATIEGYLVTTIAQYAFYNCDSLTSIVVPDSVTTIADYAFMDSGKLASVTLPDSVMSIGEEAFVGTALYNTAANRENGVLYVGNHLIEAQTTLSGTYTVKDGTKAIADKAFYDCCGITAVVLPKSVTNIGVKVFGCYSVDHPDDLPLEGEELCKGPKLADVWCRGSQYDYRAMTIDADNAYLLNAEWHYNVCEEHVYTAVCDDTCNACGWVREAAEHTYTDGCDESCNRCGAKRTTEHLYDTICDTTCNVCGATRTVSHIYDDDTDIYCNVCGRVRYLTYTISNGEVTITGCDWFASGELVIPSTIEGYPVTSIASRAFYDCYSTVTGIHIPAGVTNIGFRVFGCSCVYPVPEDDVDDDLGLDDELWVHCGGPMLTDVWYGGTVTDREAMTIDADNDYLLNATWHYTDAEPVPNELTYTIENGQVTITDCQATASGVLTIPATIEGYPVTTIAPYAFYNCDSLTSIVVPDSVTTIADYAFMDSGKLASVTLPDSVTSIGEEAFVGTALYNTAANWENGVLYVGNHLIKAQTTLSGAYTVKDGTKTIADNAFYDCCGITAVVLPESVTNVGVKVFGCYSVDHPDDLPLEGEELCKGPKLADVWYRGSQTDRQAMTIDADNAYLLNATWHYNACEEHVYTAVCDDTCDACGWVREATAHDYDNACDTDCNVCGVERTIEHTYDGYCDTICNVCGEFREMAIDHTYDHDCDTTCNVCGEIRSIVHRYDNGCDTTCNVCGAVRSITHTYDNVCDTDCNVCGATRAVTHSYTNSCDATCNVCGFTRTAGHRYDGYCDVLCNVCGEFRDVAVDHTYDHDCDTTCNVCGETRSIVHQYDNECDTACNVCGAVRSITHTYDGSCDIDCNVCGAKRTVTHVYDNNEDISCNACGLVRYLTYTINDGEVTITDCDPYFSGNLTIPSTIEGYPVTTIAPYTFYIRDSLTSVVVPEGVTTIAECAFMNSKKLASVTLPDSVTSIGEDAFAGTALYNTAANWENGVLYVGNHLIKAQTTLSGAYTVKVDTKTIADNAFYDCCDVTMLFMPVSVTHIGKKAFGCYRVDHPDDLPLEGEELCEGPKLTDVWYRGSETDHAAMMIDSDNAILFQAAWHDNTCSLGHTYYGGCDTTCNECDWVREAFTDHLYGEWAVHVKPTTTTEGSKRKTCTVCGDVVTETLPKLVPQLIIKGKTLELKEIVYVKMVYDLIDVDFEEVDIALDGGMLCYTPEEYAALNGNIVFDEKHACVGLDAYAGTPYYYAKSDPFYTRDLDKEYYYIGYVKLPDGTYVFSEAMCYGPKTYAYSQLSKAATPAKLKDLCVAFLNYIAAAQQQFGGVTDENLLVNKDLTEAQKAMAWDNAEGNFTLAAEVSADKQVAANTTVFKKINKTLRLQEKISMIVVYTMDKSVVENAAECGTIFWTAEQFAALSGKPSLENIGGGQIVKGLEAYNTSGTRWYSAAPGVAAKDLADTTYYMLGYVKAADGSVQYSGVVSYTFEQYIYNQANKSDNTEELIHFVKRLYAYERAARTFLK